ncbi:MAG: serine hydrolase domain-containing protein [Candidatus Electryonea clarkiae]|nr:serine hydrolase domain-containing protein [Candidatus Electryonea clarkiae]MDP8285999.1 serine hydrolase domain-containing protein [Candidatus Electryonea clarkiae]
MPLPTVSITEKKVAAIEELMDRFYDNEQFNGTILIAVKGKILYQNSTGYADRDLLILNTLDTKYRVASVTKQFTSMLVLKLVEEGKLDLKGKLTDYLPEYPKDKGSGITVHHLLTHRSGIVGEPRVPNLEQIEKLYHSPDQMVDLITSFELIAKPGIRYEYSNFGYYLLGLIIERVSGKSYGDLLQEKICASLRMENTMPDITGTEIAMRAKGYHYSYFAGPEDAPFLDMSFVYSYGHLLSTVHDLYLWDRALYGEKLLSNEMKELFFNKYGWLYQRVRVGNKGRTARANLIGASVNGFKANVLRIADDEIFITQLTNHKEHNGHILQGWGSVDIGSRILAILYDQPYDLPRKSAAYEIFRTLLDSGEDAAVKKYADLYENHQDRFWFKEEEFIILTRELHEAGMPDMALFYRRLSSN